jgi:hypothetical protein
MCPLAGVESVSGRPGLPVSIPGIKSKHEVAAVGARRPDMGLAGFGAMRDGYLLPHAIDGAAVAAEARHGMILLPSVARLPSVHFDLEGSASEPFFGDCMSLHFSVLFRSLPGFAGAIVGSGVV